MYVCVYVCLNIYLLMVNICNVPIISDLSFHNRAARALQFNRVWPTAFVWLMHSSHGAKVFLPYLRPAFVSKGIAGQFAGQTVL